MTKPFKGQWRAYECLPSWSHLESFDGKDWLFVTDSLLEKLQVRRIVKTHNRAMRRAMKEGE